MAINPLSSLKRLFSPAEQAQREAVAQGGVVVPNPAAPLFNGQPIPSYPDLGIAVPAASPDLLMESQRELIDELHQASNFSYDDFNAYLRPTIWNYAAYVHLLPASETHHHCGQGGLFRHGLEVARNAALACKAKVFAMDRWASERVHLTPRWRMCAILGGMFHDMGKPLADVGAIDGSGDREWNPHEGSIWDWLQEHQLDHYYIKWHAGGRYKRHEEYTTVPFWRLVPAPTMKWLGLHNGREVVDAVVSALQGSSDPRNPLAALLRAADSRSVELDLKDSRARLSASGLGGQRNLAARLVRTIYDAIEAGACQINKLGSPIWVTTEGIYGQYPAVLRDAISTLRDQGEKSLPTDVGSALELFADWGYLQPNVHPDGQTTNTWNLRIHATDRGKPITFDAHVIRFARDEIIPSAILPPAPLQAQILDRNGDPIPLGTIQSAGAAAPVASATASATNDAGLQPALNDEPLQFDPPTSTNAPAEDVVLRDRGNEPDARVAAIDEAYESYNRPFPPTTPHDAQAWLAHSDQQPEGSALLAIADRIRKGQFREGAQVFDVYERIHLRSPEAFAELGFDPIDLRGKLEARGWTETDSPNQTRTTVVLEHNGKRIPCTRLTDALSQVFRLLMPARALDPVSGAPTPVLVPLGPQIPGEIAARLRSVGEYDAVDGPLVRPILHSVLLNEARVRGTTPNLLKHTQIMLRLREFTTEHQLRFGWCLGHTLLGDNPVCTSPDAARALDPKANHVLQINADYRPELDEALASRVEKTP